MEEKKGLKFHIKIMLILFAVIPLTVGGLIIIIFMTQNAKSEIESVTHNYIYSMAESSGEGLYNLESSEGEAAMTTESLTEYCSDIGLIDVSSSYAYVADANGTMLYHPTAEKIGEPVTNTTILAVCADMASGKRDDADVVSYVFKGAQKYAGYWVAPDCSFVLVISADESDVMSGISSLRTQIIIVSLILEVIIVIISILLSKKIAGPISGVATEMQSLAAGKLDCNIDLTSNVEETKILIKSSEKLQALMKDVIGKTQSISNDLAGGANTVYDLSEQTATGVDQISNAMEDLANGATSMAESVQNINSSIITMGMSVDTISANTENLVQSSNNIKIATSDADEYMKKVSASSQRSVESVHNIAKQIAETSEAIKSIEMASNAISDIASQTNLLSLNASIEAARAGEAGRGFAVVASEIQKLAEQSNQSASDIMEIVQNITTQSDKTVELSSEIATIISEEQGYISETQKKFDILSHDIDTSITQISEIAGKVDDLNAVKSTITSEVQDLSAVSEENAASNEEVSASVINIAESINEVHKNSTETKALTDDLNETISFFS